MSENPARVAKDDQVEAEDIADAKVGLRTLADLVGEYWTALREQGVPPNVAAQLVRDWHAARLDYEIGEDE